MLSLLVSVAVAAAAPPPPELPASVYKDRREKVLKELGSCHALLAAKGTAFNP